MIVFNKRRVGPINSITIGVIVLIVVIALTLFFLEVSDKTHFFHDNPKTVVTTGGQYTKGQLNDANTNSPNKVETPEDTHNSSQPGDIKHEAPQSNENLVQPSGTFANVYSADTGDQMGSTCNTTPGATCQIIFTRDGSIHSLPSQVADRGGAVYWSWRPRDIGLTNGEWHITAKATLGGQSKTTSNDPLTLKIQ